MSLQSDHKFAQRGDCSLSLWGITSDLHGFIVPSRMASSSIRVSPARGRPWLYGDESPTTHARVGEMCYAH